MDISHVSNPSSSMSLRPDYQVFLSFRGPDTRKNFVDFLYTSLIDAKIRVFKDDKELELGQEINSQLIQAIEQSKISIPVISEDYASSKSCLMELDQMVKCMENKNKNHIIIPIFYYVNPSDVRQCTGPFEKALDERRKRDRDGTFLNNWKPAFCRIGKLAGHHLHEKYEKSLGDAIKEIVHKVEQELQTRDLIVPKRLVGVDPHVQEIMAKLKVDYRNGQADKIGDACEKVLLIHGIPGVGKTVLAKCLYNKLNHLFDACSFLDCSFLENIQEEIRDHGIVSVQNRLISHVNKGFAKKFDYSDPALEHIQKSFLAKKVLLLLDDVKDDEQLSKLVGELDWLSPESRVIVTSRRCDVLKRVNGRENYILGSMKEDNALTLFCKHAFGTDSPPEGFKELATKIVAATDGLPLVLKKVGKSLFQVTTKKAWREKLSQLKEAPDEIVQGAFLKMYKTLSENEQNIFLDIACFFNGKDKRIPYHMWLDLKFLPTLSILSLHAMSLVEIGEDKELRMREILTNFGREIVKSENKDEPCQRSRLCNHNEALDVLIGRKGTKSVKALGLDYALGSKWNIILERDDFVGLQSLKFLKLDQADIQGNFLAHFSSLRWLDWQGNPRIFEDHSNLNLQKLVILDLSRSQVHKSWRGWNLLVEARNLKVLKLACCVQLTATPTFPASMQLERLILEGCSNLAVIDPSFGNLTKLVSLNMKGCSLIRELPDLGPLGSLKEVVIDGTSISRINFQEGSLMELKTLNARNCKDLTDISDSIRYLKSLKYLSLDGSGIHTLPESIGSLEKLETVSLKNCQRLTDLPDAIRLARLTAIPRSILR